MEYRARMDNVSHLILASAHRDQLNEGITVITKGEGIRVFDQDGRSYLDLVAGVTRPVQVGYGLKEMPLAAYEQMWEDIKIFRKCIAKQGKEMEFRLS